MTQDEVAQKTLTKNAIKNFILRIDLIRTDELNVNKLAQGMTKYFDRAEKRHISKYNITITKGVSEIEQGAAFDVVLVSEGKGMSMTFSEMQNAFWIESTQYRDNSVYKDIISETISVINSSSMELQSRRIGLRYINEFRCEKHRDIGKIYGKRLATILRSMLTGSNQSRIIGLEEYNNEEYRLRLQYGIRNKFYPAAISVFDLLLDIDSYIEDTNELGEWNDVIRNLNHAAYDQFTKEINPKYLEELQ